MSNNQFTDKQKKGCAIGCFSVIGIIVVLLFGAFILDSVNNAKKSSAAEKSLDTSLPITERLEYAVIGALGEKNNMDESRSITVSEAVKNAYTISFLASENMTTNLQISTLESDIIDVLEAIQPIEGLQAVIIQAKMKFNDKYGNELIDNGLNISIQKSEIDKINFENFYSSQLKNVALYNLHPALGK